MIYVTGDTHGGIDVRKLLDKRFQSLTKDDYIIICGDFGFVYNFKKESRKERKWLDWFKKMPWTTLFVDGNHECFPRLNSYPEIPWHGGTVHQIRENVFHLMRGEIYEIDGNRIFAMGGAASHDRGPAVGDTKQVIGRFWWPEEIPSEEEMAYARENLARYGDSVDYIITHCLPTQQQRWLKQDKYPPDAMTEFLEQICKEVNFNHWYGGHYHRDQDLSGNITDLFNRVIEIGETIACSKPIAGSPIYEYDDEVMMLRDGKLLSGIIVGVYPWGKFPVKDQSVYHIRVGEEVIKHVKETDILGYAV